MKRSGVLFFLLIATSSIFGMEAMSYDSLYQAGKASIRDQNLGEAIEIYTQLLKNWPNDADALLARGRLYAWTKQYDLSQIDLLQVTQKYPDYADAWSALGDLYYWQEKSADAEQAYIQYQKRKPSDPDPLIKLAKVQLQTRQYTKARRYLQRAKLLGAASGDIVQLEQAVNRVQIPTNWQAGGSYLHTKSSLASDAYTLNVMHRWNHLSAGLDMRRVNYSTGNYANYLAVDTYADVWRNAYLNLWSSIYSLGDGWEYNNLRVSVFQAVGGYYEMIGGYTLYTSDAAKTEIYSAGAGAYLGDNYLTLILSDVYDQHIESQRMAAINLRHYLGNADRYIQTGVVELKNLDDSKWDSQIQALAQWYFIQTAGINLGYYYATIGKTYGINAGIQWRW